MTQPAPVRWAETAESIPCDGDHLVGVHTRPEGDAVTGLVILSGGTQYRAGAHRQNVLLARNLAGAGIASLRFDCRGVGDSTGDYPGFESLGPDIQAAKRRLRERNPRLERLFLWGLCDGASAIILHLPDTGSETAGVILVNPWARTERSLAAAQVNDYLPRRARSPEFWRKLLTGKIDLIGKLREIRDLIVKARAPQSEDLPARLGGILSAAQVPSLIILAQHDLTAVEFRSTVLGGRASVDSDTCQIYTVTDADHTFSDPQKWQQVQHHVLDWLGRR